jgi:hypothetical protein
VTFETARPAQDGLTPTELTGLVTAMEVRIPTAQMDCNNGTMNDHMLRALKAEAFPEILFRMLSYQVVPGAQGGDTVLELSGELQLAGSRRIVPLRLAATPREQERVQLTGTYPLTMTEYGIAPPRLFLGTLRVGERVDVMFDLILAASSDN